MGIGLNSVDYMRVVWGFIWFFGLVDSEGGDDVFVFIFYFRNFYRDVGGFVWKVNVNVC